MAYLNTEEGERHPSFELLMMDAGKSLASITVITTEENELRIVVERHEDDPTVSLTVV